jgi:hypothetical protein
MECGRDSGYHTFRRQGGSMKAINILLVAASISFAASPAYAERCMAASTGADGEPVNTPVIVDLASETRLDPAALPERTVGVMCPRSSIIPLTNDVRILSEWHVAFGIREEGPSSLWIGARAGRLEFTVDHGELTTREKAAVNEWLEAANIRFLLEWSRR